MSLQTRLMTAVIGFVSLILVIVAVITSATLGQTLEERLDGQVRALAVKTTDFVETKSFFGTAPGAEVTVQSILDGSRLQGPDLLLAIAPPDGAVSGVLATQDGENVDLTDTQLQELTTTVNQSPHASVSISGLGSFRVAVTQTDNGIIVVTGLPRSEILATMTQLFTVIALATLGGLILLALTTAITIRVGLRPLRAVAITATRVANQPLDRGEVTITERVPASEADPRTETGLVGASLNKLLDHVNTSLAARQKNEERMRRFVADASHELRTPLASIRGYSELSLRDTTLPENTHTALERIQAQSLRMTRLVEDLLLLARLDEGRELVYGTVDLTQLALEGLADARPTAPDHRWSVDVPDEPVVIVGDAGRMHQVVANLLANARTHTPAGTEITLRVAQEADTAVLTVHDNGPGIDPGVRDELFARFARGDSSRARQTGGTGLGLAIVKAIVESHSGYISVASEPGSTSFTVRIPVNPSKVDAPAG
ncbi:sensor histidine kinase [Microbacterium aurantiacum]|uniref:sensor histidine kinase n=1 Tax=Microbacterium aurantiacum TaxID=162393 RepID=UPI000C7FE0BD|nr:ATP-binding protein [Microbacterium aurantiacum]